MREASNANAPLRDTHSMKMAKLVTGLDTASHWTRNLAMVKHPVLITVQRME
jgi:hypothetical protein